LIKFYQASELLWWSLGRMCWWYVVDFMLICGIFWARFWWGWLSRDGSILNAVLGWNFTNLVRLKWMYVIAMATWWGQHMCMRFKPNHSKWLQSYVYFIAFMFFSSYATQAVEVRVCWFCSFFHSLVQNQLSLLILWLTHSTTFPFQSLAFRWHSL
jgi:hypothetical protein